MTIRRLIAFLAPLFVVTGALLAAGADSDSARVLVAPLPATGPDLEGPFGDAVAALPALVAEAISADRDWVAAQTHDLSPDTRESLGLDPMANGPLADAAKLAEPGSVKPLAADGSIRILVLPAVESMGSPGKPEIALTLTWRDLATGKTGAVREKAKDAKALIDAAGRAAAAAVRQWSPDGAPDRGAKDLAALTSKDPGAVALWARAAGAWNHGEVPSAESSLSKAIAADPAFDRARVDLAWIRLGEGRLKEARALAGAALSGKRLSGSARDLAEISAAAAAGDAAALETLGARLVGESPASPCGPLATGLALNLKGDHPRAIAYFDQVRLHRPNDPAVLHEAGIAALGQGDYFEARTELERAARLWPEHDRIQMDLAETLVRAHDIDAAGKVLEAWGQRWRPGVPPIWGGEWTYDDPPPILRSQMVNLLRGAVSKSIDSIGRQELLMEAASSSLPVELLVLRTMHEMQTELAFGDELWKQRWLNAARDSLARLKELTPPEEQKASPWVLLKLEALLRVREGRLPEARELREKIAASSSLPGFDPFALSKVDVAIALKVADTDKVFEIRKQAVETRGSIEDLYELGESYAITARWKEATPLVAQMKDRLETWSATRRQDAILWSPRGATLVPYIYSLAGETGVWLGDVDGSRKEFGIFLSYFTEPDLALKPYRDEAEGRGATPAW